MRIIKAILVTGIAVTLAACSNAKRYGGSTVPAVIRKQVSIYEKSASCDDAHVDELTFQNATVYLFDPGKCGADMTSDVYDMKGNLLGSLGGIRGNVRINGEDFDKAVKKRTIWAKTAAK
jgi:hypothetical protein